MSTLLVSAHPDPNSLTQHVVRQLEEALRAGGADGVEVADLAQEQFDPRFTLDDRRSYSEPTYFPDDVATEQRRLERATDVVLVFPVYWWSMPALLKGWIDRVFVNGWAFEATEAGINRKLQRLRIHLVPIAGDDAGVYERHGYEQSLLTQIEHGIVDYCGSRRGVTAFIYSSEQDDSAATLAGVDRVVSAISDAVYSSDLRVSHR